MQNWLTQGKSIRQFRNSSPRVVFPQAQTYPSFFDKHLVHPYRRIKALLNDPNANIRAFYFQYLMLCFQIENQNYEFYIGKIQKFIQDPNFCFLFLEDDDEKIFNDSQFKRFIIQFMQILDSGEFQSTQAALNAYPIADIVFVYFFRSLAIYANITNDFDSYIDKSILFGFLLENFTIDAQMFEQKCIKFVQAQVFVYEQTPQQIYLVYKDVQSSMSQSSHSKMSESQDNKDKKKHGRAAMGSLQSSKVQKQALRQKQKQDQSHDKSHQYQNQGQYENSNENGKFINLNGSNNFKLAGQVQQIQQNISMLEQQQQQFHNDSSDINAQDNNNNAKNILKNSQNQSKANLIQKNEVSYQESAFKKNKPNEQQVPISSAQAQESGHINYKNLQQLQQQPSSLSQNQQSLQFQRHAGSQIQQSFKQSQYQCHQEPLDQQETSQNKNLSTPLIININKPRKSSDASYSNSSGIDRAPNAGQEGAHYSYQTGGNYILGTNTANKNADSNINDGSKNNTNKKSIDELVNNITIENNKTPNNATTVDHRLRTSSQNNSGGPKVSPIALQSKTYEQLTNKYNNYGYGFTSPQALIQNKVTRTQTTTTTTTIPNAISSTPPSNNASTAKPNKQVVHENTPIYKIETTPVRGYSQDYAGRYGYQDDKYNGATDGYKYMSNDIGAYKEHPQYGILLNRQRQFQASYNNQNHNTTPSNSTPVKQNINLNQNQQLNLKIKIQTSPTGANISSSHSIKDSRVAGSSGANAVNLAAQIKSKVEELNGKFANHTNTQNYSYNKDSSYNYGLNEKNYDYDYTPLKNTPIPPRASYNQASKPISSDYFNTLGQKPDPTNTKPTRYTYPYQYSQQATNNTFSRANFQSDPYSYSSVGNQNLYSQNEMESKTKLTTLTGNTSSRESLLQGFSQRDMYKEKEVGNLGLAGSKYGESYRSSGNLHIQININGNGISNIGTDRVGSKGTSSQSNLFNALNNQGLAKPIQTQSQIITPWKVNQSHIPWHPKPTTPPVVHNEQTSVSNPSKNRDLRQQSWSLKQQFKQVVMTKLSVSKQFTDSMTLVKMGQPYNSNIKKMKTRSREFRQSIINSLK